MATTIVSVHPTRFFTLLSLEIRRMVVSVAENGAKMGLKFIWAKRKLNRFIWEIIRMVAWTELIDWKVKSC